MLTAIISSTYSSAKGNRARQWMNDASVLVVGNALADLPERQGHILQVSAPDGYNGYTCKLGWACSWALEEKADSLLVVSDDMSASIQAIEELATRSSAPLIGFVKNGELQPNKGFVLSRRAMRHINKRLWVVEGIDATASLNAVLRQACLDCEHNEQFNGDGNGQLVWAAWLAPQNNVIIPKKFHFVWLGGKEMPPNYRAYIRSWRAFHPDWEITIWNEDTLFVLRNQAEYERGKSWSQKSDMVRYEVLHRYGGVYLDTDVECTQNIESLIGSLDCFAGWEDSGTICSAVIGSVPGHPAIDAMIRAIPESFSRGNENEILSTGPGLLTSVLKDRSDIKLFPPHYFYPIHWNGSRFDGPSYATHHWSMSWKK